MFYIYVYIYIGYRILVRGGGEIFKEQNFFQELKNRAPPERFLPPPGQILFLFLILFF